MDPPLTGIYWVVLSIFFHASACVVSRDIHHFVSEYLFQGVLIAVLTNEVTSPFATKGKFFFPSRVLQNIYQSSTTVELLLSENNLDVFLSLVSFSHSRGHFLCRCHMVLLTSSFKSFA